MLEPSTSFSRHRRVRVSTPQHRGLPSPVVSDPMHGPSPSIIITTTGYGPSIIDRAPALRFVDKHGLAALFRQCRPNPYSAPTHSGSSSSHPQPTVGFGSPRRTAGAAGKRTQDAASPSHRRRIGTSSAVNSPKRNSKNTDKGGANSKSRDNIEISGLIRCVRAACRRGSPTSDNGGDEDEDEEEESSTSEESQDNDDDMIEVVLDQDDLLADDSTSSDNDDDDDADFAPSRRDASSAARRGAETRRKSRRAPSVGSESSDTFSTASRRVAGKAGSRRASNKPAHDLAAHIAARMQAACRTTNHHTNPVVETEDASGLRLLKPARGTVRLTVVLDLDETLVRLREGASYVRPQASRFFEVLKAIPNVEIVIWTCATEKYARRALQHIRGAVWHHIIARDPRWYTEPAVKNMAWLGRDMDKCIMIDNCPVAVSANPDNCIVVQDIPECLPQVDETLWHVAQAIVDVVASGRPVSDALNQSEHVSTVAFQVAEGDDESSDAAEVTLDDPNLSTPSSCSSPQFLPSDMGESCDMTTPTANLSHAFPMEEAKAATPIVQRPQFIIARTLNYSIPSVRATYGSLEMPAKRLSNEHDRD